MTPTLATIRFESAYQLCHVNAIDVHSMCIESGLQQATCECALTLMYVHATNVYTHVHICNRFHGILVGSHHYMYDNTLN